MENLSYKKIARAFRFSAFQPLIFCRQVITHQLPSAKAHTSILIKQHDSDSPGGLIEIGMTRYIAIIEDAGPDYSVGVRFPDLPGCTSAGDDLDEALHNAPKALALYLEGIEEMPRARSFTELKNDPDVAPELKNYMFALIELPKHAHAAE